MGQAPREEGVLEWQGMGEKGFDMEGVPQEEDFVVADSGRRESYRIFGDLAKGAF